MPSEVERNLRTYCAKRRSCIAKPRDRFSLRAVSRFWECKQRATETQPVPQVSAVPNGKASASGTFPASTTPAGLRQKCLALGPYDHSVFIPRDCLTQCADPVFASAQTSAILVAMDRANVVIIGGGVVGCAVARVVSRRWDNVFLLEQMPKVGMGTSTRNSGVIHSGLYYTPGSLKARHCLEGNRLTYEFCEAHNVPHRRTGKLIVATSPEEAGELEELAAHGRANGVEGIRRLDAAGIRAREPHIRGVAAIEIPSTGIVSSEELVKA